MNQSLTSRIVAVLCLALVTLQAFGGTIQGAVQNAQGGPLPNGTFSFKLSQAASVAGTASVIKTPVNCWTDQNGNTVGEPNGTGNTVPGGAAPSLSVNLGSGTLAAGTYFVKLWFFDATGDSFPSPEGSINLAAPGTLIVNHPLMQPANATGYRVGIGATSGSETLQGTVTGTTSNFSQSAALAAGSALPVSNTTSCKVRFNDEMTPSFTCYDVGLTGTNGLPVPGYPQYWYLYGGSSGTINIASGTPQSTICQGGGISFPQAIVATPINNATQSIAGNIDLGAFSLSATNVFNRGFLQSTEIAAPSCPAGFDVIWGDSTAHRMKECDNGGAVTTIAELADNLGAFASGGAISPTSVNTTSVTATTVTTGQIIQPAATALTIKDNQGGTRLSIPSNGTGQGQINNTALTGTSTSNSVNLFSTGCPPQGPTASINGTGAAVDIFTCALPANVIENLKILHVICSTVHDTGTANVTLTMNLNGQNFINATTGTTASQSGALEAYILRTGTTTAQTWGFITTGTPSAMVPFSVALTGLSWTSGTQTLNCQFTVAAGDHMTGRVWAPMSIQ